MKIAATGLTKDYGGHRVVDIADLSFGEHGLEGLIGPNGAGKSTLMGLLTRRIAPSSGEISLLADDGTHALNPLSSHEVSRIGLIKTNQRIQGFDSLTIRDNLRLAATAVAEEGPRSILDPLRDPDAIEAQIDRYLGMFSFSDPDGFARSGGEKKLVDILRCLMARPKMLLMDEPTAGLPDDITEAVMDLIKAKVEAKEMTVVVVEHDLPMIWKYCGFVHFLSEGKVLFQGSPDDVKSNRLVAEKYMGV